MNYTTARCGHSIVAVGADGSEARRKSRQELCPECREATGFAVFPPPDVSADERVFGTFEDADDYAAEQQEASEGGHAARIVPLFAAKCAKCGDLADQDAVRLLGEWFCEGCDPTKGA